MFNQIPVRIAALLLMLASPAMGQDGAIGSLPLELEAGESPLETWELNRLAIVRQRHTKISFLGLPIVTEDSWWPVRGKYRYGLSRQEFFERAGDEGLAHRQSARDTWSDSLFYGGFVVALGGSRIRSYFRAKRASKMAISSSASAYSSLA